MEGTDLQRSCWGRGVTLQLVLHVEVLSRLPHIHLGECMLLAVPRVAAFFVGLKGRQPAQQQHIDS